MQRAAFSFIRFSRRFQLRIVDHLHLCIGEVERFHVLHLFDLRVNHRFKRRRVEPDAMLAENLFRIRQLLVAIARAVVANPKLILADEPTGNLDSKNGKEVMELLNELNKEGTTIIMVTHSQHDAGFAGRIINLFDGQVVTEVSL